MSLTVSSVLSWAHSSHSDSDFVRNSGPFIQLPLQTNASAVTSSLGISYSFIKILFSWTDTVAAVNSNLGVVVSFKGARRDLPTRNEQWIWPWVSTKQRYDKHQKPPERRHKSDGYGWCVRRRASLDLHMVTHSRMSPFGLSTMTSGDTHCVGPITCLIC